MTIEHGEEVFGAHWSAWTDAQNREWVRALDRTEARTPLLVRLVAQYPEENPGAYTGFALGVLDDRFRP